MNLEVYNENKISEELIKVDVNENFEHIVSGRELHKKLEIKTPYKKWFDRMCEYGFLEGVDFTLFGQKCPSSNASGIQYMTDHILKIDMAKEVAMLQRNDIGRKFRRYFIEVEKEYNSPEKIMARALEIANKELRTVRLINKAQEQQILELKPKADYTDEILKTKDCLTVTQIAKDYGMSAKALNSKLNKLKVQYNQSGQWLLYSKYQNCGYTKSETIVYEKENGETGANLHTK